MIKPISASITFLDQNGCPGTIDPNDPAADLVILVSYIKDGTYHSAIYHQQDDIFEYMNGGGLITDRDSVWYKDGIYTIEQLRDWLLKSMGPLHPRKLKAVWTAELQDELRSYLAEPCDLISPLLEESYYGPEFGNVQIPQISIQSKLKRYNVN